MFLKIRVWVEKTQLLTYSKAIFLIFEPIISLWKMQSDCFLTKFIAMRRKDKRKSRS